MNLRTLTMLFALTVPAVSAFGQSIPNSPPDALQVRYAASLNFGDAFINITNAGTQTTATGGLTNICANVYAFTPDEYLFSCCSCMVTPDALVSLSVQHDIMPNSLTLNVPTAIVVKLVASTPTGNCNPSAATPDNLATGLVAWGTTLHAVTVGETTTAALTESPFVQKGLSAADLARMVGYCGFIQANGSGFGICRSCRKGGLGAIKQ